MATRKVVKKTTKAIKTVKKPRQTPVQLDEPNKVTTYLNTLKTFHTRRTYYTFLLVSGLLILIFLATRFMVVAWVDKQPISRLDYFRELDQKYGKDLKEQMIVEKLLANEAKKSGVTVSEQEITGEMKKIEDAQGGADQLNQILQVQGISKDEFKKLVKLQVLKQKVFGKDVVISDDDVNKYIQGNKEQFKDVDLESSASGKVKEGVREQLKQQKINTNFNDFIKNNLNSPRVIRVS